MSAGLQPLVRRKNNPPFAFSHAHRTTIPTSTNRSIEMFAHGAFVPSFQYTSLTNREAFMSLKTMGTIEIPAAAGSEFDHGAFDAKTRRVFVAHTARNCMEVIDHDTQQHIATLPGFAEAAGVVADNGMVLVTNRGAASLSVVDAVSLKTQAVFSTTPRPNGVAIVPQQHLAIVACIGDDSHRPSLLSQRLDGGKQHAINLPGRPRWCATDAAAKWVFLAIRDPSMVLVARLPNLTEVEQWPLPSGGAHGLDIDQRRGRIYVACDDGALVEVDIGVRAVSNQWPIAGVPDATFFNPATGLVHVAIGEPGLVQSIDPQTGAVFRPPPPAATRRLPKP
jgi:DNA-binding beta-propeller fold protein YncE